METANGDPKPGVVMKIEGYPIDLPCPEAGQYLVAFDADAFDGRGHIEASFDKARAMIFQSTFDGMQFWKTQSRTHPRRSDGKPNRPLTAFTVTFEPSNA